MFDLLGSTVVVQRKTTTQVLFNEPGWQSHVDTFANNGGGISESPTGIELHTGPGALGVCSVYTKESSIHMPSAEAGFSFAWRLSHPKAKGAYARVGAADDEFKNGVWIGYEGDNFGVTVSRNGNPAPVIVQANWIDRCDGNLDSLYKSGGVPVPLDPTKTQITRIRTQLGFRGYVVEIQSPDGEWIKVVNVSGLNESKDIISAFTLKLAAEVRRITGEPFDSSLFTSDWSMYDTGVDETRSDPVRVTNDVRLHEDNLEMLQPLVPHRYDDIALGYTGKLLTSVRYFKHGALVATLNLAYTNGALTRVTRL